jgi:hypothetical protein
VPKHAELAPPGEHDRADARREPEQADEDGDGLQRVGHRERAIENPQRCGLDLARPGDF